MFDQIRNAVDDLETVSRDARAVPARWTPPPPHSSSSRRGASGSVRRSRRSARDASRRRMHGARAAIAAPHTGSPRQRARRSAPPAERWRRRVRSNTFRGPRPRSVPVELSPTQAAEITSAAGADPAAESAAAGDGSRDGREGPTRPLPRGARRRRGRRRGWARRLQSSGGRTAGPIPTASTASRRAWRRMPGRDSTPRGRRTSSESSGKPAALGGVSRTPHTPPTHSSRWPAKGRASPSRSARSVDSAASCGGTSSRASGARSPASVRFRYDGSGVARRRVRDRDDSRRRRHHGCVTTDADDPQQAAPSARDPLPEVRRAELCATTSSWRSTTSFRSKTTARQRSPTSGGLFTPPCAEDVSGLEGRRRQRRSRPRSTR